MSPAHSICKPHVAGSYLLHNILLVYCWFQRPLTTRLACLIVQCHTTYQPQTCLYQLRKSVKCLLCTVQCSKRAEINHTFKCQQHKQEALYVILTSIAGGNYIVRSSVAANFKPVYTQAVWLHVATESTLKVDGYNQKSCDSHLNKPFTNSFSQAA